MIAKHGSAPAFGDAIAAMLTCETCGRTPADTLFSRRMHKRCRCLDPQVVRFQRCFGYVLCTWRSRRAARGYDLRWQLFVENGYVNVGQAQRRWLCRDHAPLQIPNPNATACATFECPFPVPSATQKCVTRAASAFAINAKPLEHNGSTSYFLSVVFFNNSPCAIFYVPIFLIRWSVDFL